MILFQRTFWNPDSRTSYVLVDNRPVPLIVVPNIHRRRHPLRGNDPLPIPIVLERLSHRPAHLHHPVLRVIAQVVNSGIKRLIREFREANAH